MKKDLCAADLFASKYKQIVYNQENGLDSVSVNAIYQTKSGYIWVGTESGLYRYNSSEFKVMNLWDTEKADIYCINYLFQDSADRLWVGTDNYGLFFIKGSTINHFTDDYYAGIKSIYSVVEDDNGIIYVATKNGLYIADTDNLKLKKLEPLGDKSVIGLINYNSSIYGICEGNEIFSYADNTLDIRQASDFTQEDISCINVANGYALIGTNGNDVVRLKDFSHFEILNSGKDGVKFIYGDDLGRTFILCDNGLGYFDNNWNFIAENDMTIDSYLTGMVKDGEGNYWFSSSRFGVLKLGFSKFTDYNEENNIEENITNCFHQYRGYNYIGTDLGLVMTDIRDVEVHNELTEMLSNVAVKYIMHDNVGNIWISTYRRYGVVKYAVDGTISHFGRSNGIASNQINCTAMLPDGNIAVGTEEGITIIDTDGNVIKNISEKEGLADANVTCLIAEDDGRIFVGTDSGMYIISNEDALRITEAEGLNSNSVISFCKGEAGLWIGTDTGLYFFSETVRQISNIDFSNSIYDIQADAGYLYLVTSKGILKTTEPELFSQEGVSGRYWYKNDGMDKTITLNSKCFVDSNHILYICCNEGVDTLNLKSVPVNETAPKLIVSEVEVDGVSYMYDELGGSLSVPPDTSKITIHFSVLCYTNRENLRISYMLEGFDKEYVVINGNSSLQAVYTNLDGGTYNFVIEATSADGVKSEQNVSLEIVKKTGFFENKLIRILFILLILFVLAVVAYFAVKFEKAVIAKNKELANLSKAHEAALKSSTAKTDYLANMSNEIKTPINAIIRLSENMLGNGLTNIEHIDNLHRIIDSSNDIIDKVDGIILLAKLESGKVQAVNATYSITTLVCDLSDRIINQLGDRPIKFFVEIGDDIPDVLIGDFDKIKEVLQLILDNAQKFTSEGSITLSVDCYLYNESNSEETLENLVFSVSDTGIGISEDKIEHIFEVYNIADNKKNNGLTGNGVSLAIAKKLTEIMDGEIVCDSTAGAGSTFTLSLIQKKPEKNIYQAVSDDSALQLISKEEAERLFTPDVTALLIDDMEVNRTVALSVLNQFEMKVDVATSGVGAIDMVMNNEYDIVFMDLSMPVMSGTDAMKEIRELEGDKYKVLPIIAMTEDAVGEDRSSLLESGFDDVVLKPVDIRSFATVISSHVSAAKIKHRTNNMIQYIRESRYNEGLENLQNSLEVVKVLEKIGGSIEVYNKIISTFYNQNINACEDLREKFDKDYRGFRNRVHNIKTGSINIGAREVSKMASKLESAINIGNKDYIRDNLSKFIKMMEALMQELYVYLTYVEDKQGITENEYAARLAREMEGVSAFNDVDENDVSVRFGDGEEDGYWGYETSNSETSSNSQGILERIDKELLLLLKDSISRLDGEGMERYFKTISENEYSADDKGFISAIKENLDNNDLDAAVELIDTYMDLKY